MAEPDEVVEPSSRSRMNRAAGVPSGTLRWAWATLTSMRTALALLMLLGIAAIPGSLFPQRPTDPFGVAAYRTANPELGDWLDRFGLFDVFGSAWFAAIYLMLFLSLIGCIIPRCRAYAQAWRADPVPVPRRLTRFTHLQGGADAEASSVLADAATHLRARRYRLRLAANELSAERGYTREAGNLVFHLALVVMLLGMAWGSLASFRGTAVVVEGSAFSNTITQYDEFSAGVGFRPEQLAPFTVQLEKFTVRFETGATQRGTAREFRADVSVTEAGTTRTESLEVNHPLSVGGNSIHLLGHGYAPVVTVKDGNGDVAFSGPVIFQPQDTNFTSAGIIKAPDGRPQRLAFEGFFLPTAVTEPAMVSAFPDAWNPMLLVNAWVGPPKVETGEPENIYQLDKTGLTQLFREDGEPLRSGLGEGATFTLPDGQGSLTFDGWRRWTKLQFSQTPGSTLTLIAVLVAIAGLTVSLLVRPRRLFVRMGEVTEVAGMDKVEGRPGLVDEVNALAAVVGLTARLTGEDAEAGGEGST